MSSSRPLREHSKFPPLVLMLFRMVRYLRAGIRYLLLENRILRSRLRSKPKLTVVERILLLRCALATGPLLKAIVSIVKPKTLLGWRSWARTWLKKLAQPSRRGRPRRSLDLERIIIRMAQENEWGYYRICGELQKLGILAGKTYIKNVLKRNGIAPVPWRKGLSWKRFLQRQMGTLFACDFLTEDVFTMRGVCRYYILFAINLLTRKVRVAGSTASPTESWMYSQALTLVDEIVHQTNCDVQASSGKIPYLIRDRDGLFRDSFDITLRKKGIRIIKLPIRSPDLNAYAERWVRSVRQECLNKLLFLGEEHLLRVLKMYEWHYNEMRPHQGIANAIPGHYRRGVKQEQVVLGDLTGRLRSQTCIPGLLRYYYWQSVPAKTA